MGAPPWWPAECWNVPPKGIDSCGTALGIVQSHQARRNASLETLFRPARPAGGRGRGAEEAWGINGTGFLVAVPSKFAGMDHVYAVTNRHLACQRWPTVRVNTLDGGTDVFD